jgi:hypothetical protein
MESYLEQIVGEEMKFIGLSGETFQQSPTGSTPDPRAAAREIELAIDALHPKYPYDLPVQPEYTFDPDYASELVVLLVGWPMPEPPSGPHLGW